MGNITQVLLSKKGNSLTKNYQQNHLSKMFDSPQEILAFKSCQLMTDMVAMAMLMNRDYIELPGVDRKSCKRVSFRWQDENLFLNVDQFCSAMGIPRNELFMPPLGLNTKQWVCIK